MPTDLFEKALAAESDERMVRLSLAALETQMRDAALMSIAGYVDSGRGDSAMFQSVAGLRRPAWGTWNGLLIALEQVRRSVLREGVEEHLAPWQAGTRLGDLLTALEAPIGPDDAERMRPLGELVGARITAKTPRRVALATAITLRNRVAHDQPTDPAWWADAATVLRPFIRAAVALPIDPPGERPAPWFIDVDGKSAAFNGIDNKHRGLYVEPGGHAHPSAADGGQVLALIQRMLGKDGIQETDFRRLLGKLAPAEVRGVLMDDYLVGPPVGAGGYGTVHLGRQLSTNRQVAIKLLHDGATDDMRARFRQEAQFLVRLEHPHIVRAFDVGEATWRPPRAFSLDDEPWFAEFKKGAAVKNYLILEWVQGQTLDETYTTGKPAADRKTLLRWFDQAGAALAAVHAAGLVHRDIKPSNLMVRDDGQIKLMDFGVARSQDEHRTLQTTAGRALGTVAYMSPEQLRAADADAQVGPASDIYSLCATFYELYIGHRLFDHDTTDAHTVEMAKRNHERPAPARSRIRDVSWEINTILAVGLDPEPEQRYADGAELHRDLRHVLADEPIEKRPPSAWHRARLAYRRNRTVINLAATFALAAAVGIAFYIASITAEQRRTQKANQNLVSEQERVKEANRQLLDEQALTAAERDEKERQRTRSRQALSRVREEQGLAALSDEPLGGLLYFVEAAALLPEDDPRRRSLVSRLAAAAKDVLLPRNAASLDDAVYLVQFSPEGQRAAMADAHHRVWLWDVRGAEVPRLVAEPEGYPHVLQWTRDGEGLLTYTNAGDELRRWRFDGEPAETVLRGLPFMQSPILSPDQNRLAGHHGDDGHLIVVEVTAGQQPLVLPDNATGQTPALFDVTGRFLLTSEFVDWDTPTALERWRQVDLQTGESTVLVDQPKGEGEPHRPLVASPDLAWVSFVDDAGRARLFAWPEWTEQALEPPPPDSADEPDGPALSVTFAADASQLEVCSKDRRLYWSLEPPAFLGRRDIYLFYHNRTFASLPDGRTVFLDRSDASYGTWDGRSFVERGTQALGRTISEWHVAPVGTVALADAAGDLLIAFDLEQLTRPPSATGQTVLAQAGDDREPVHAFAPEADVLATGDKHGVVRAWDVRSGELIHKRDAHAGGVQHITLTADGRTVATAGHNGSLRLESLIETDAPPCFGEGYPVETPVFVEDESGFGSMTVLVSASGKRLVTHGYTDSGDPTLTSVLDGENDRTVGRIGQADADDPLDHYALHPSKDLMVTCSREGAVQVWDLDEATPLGPAHQVSEPLHLHMSRDANRILVLSRSQLDVFDWEGQRIGSISVKPSDDDDNRDYLLVHDSDLAVVVTPDQVFHVDPSTATVTAELALEGLANEAPTAAAVDRLRHRLLVAAGWRVATVDLTDGASSTGWIDTYTDAKPIDFVDTVVTLAHSPEDRWLLGYASGRLETRNPNGDLIAQGSGMPFSPLDAVAHGAGWLVRYEVPGQFVMSDGFATQVQIDADLKIVHQPLAHNAPVIHLTFVGEDDVLVSVALDGMLRRWDTTTGSEVGEAINVGAHPDAVRVDPAGDWVAVGFSKQSGDERPPRVELYDLRTGDLRYSIELPVEGADDWESIEVLLDVSSDGAVLLAGTGRGYLRSFNTADGSPRGPWLFEPSEGYFGTEALRLDTAGDRALLWSDDEFRVLTLADGKPVSPRVENGHQLVRRMGFTPDGHRVFTISDSSVQTWDIATGQPVVSWGDIEQDLSLLDGYLDPQAGWIAWQADGIWRQAPAAPDRPLAHYRTLFEAQAGLTLDETGTLNPLDTEGIRERLQTLRSAPALQPEATSRYAEP